MRDRLVMEVVRLWRLSDGGRLMRRWSKWSWRPLILSIFASSASVFFSMAEVIFVSSVEKKLFRDLGGLVFAGREEGEGLEVEEADEGTGGGKSWRAFLSAAAL